jgi:hypothetical protein
MHRTINARLRTLINHAQTDWEEKLPSIEFQINCATNQSTGFAPFVLDMGRMPRSPLSSVVSDFQLTPDVENASPEALKQASAKFIDKLKANLIEARDNIVLAQEQQRAAANAHRRPEMFTVGDRVLIQATALRTLSVQALRPKSKLDLKFEGPFTITKLVGDNAYEVDLPVRYGVHNVFNISKLKRYYPDESFPGRTPPKPPVDMSHASGPEYVIHDILARRRLRGRQGANPNDPRRFEYLTHWEGERQDEATWERYEQFVTDGVVAQPLLNFIQQQQEPEKGKSVTMKKPKSSKRKSKAKSR